MIEPDQDATSELSRSGGETTESSIALGCLGMIFIPGFLSAIWMVIFVYVVPSRSAGFGPLHIIAFIPLIVGLAIWFRTSGRIPTWVRIALGITYAIVGGFLLYLIVVFLSIASAYGGF